MVHSSFGDRKYKKLVLFDVDGTLTPARQVCNQIYIPLSLVERFFDR
jgi:phosphoserine phosphatase